MTLRPVRDGDFYPFDWATGTDMDKIAVSLDLNRTQKELLLQQLRRIQIKIWLSDLDANKSSKDAQLVLEVFWEFWRGEHVAGADLCKMLAEPFNERNSDMLTDEEEIDVLNKLKSMVNTALEARRCNAEVAQSNSGG